jgi:hypothetical protein
MPLGTLATARSDGRPTWRHVWLFGAEFDLDDAVGLTRGRSSSHP